MIFIEEKILLNKRMRQLWRSLITFIFILFYKPPIVCSCELIFFYWFSHRLMTYFSTRKSLHLIASFRFKHGHSSNSLFTYTIFSISRYTFSSKSTWIMYHHLEFRTFAKYSEKFNSISLQFIRTFWNLA